MIPSGAITQYEEGNATLRWIVDKNSWALGGGIAATQTPDEFMAEVARKIGVELSTSRKIGRIGKQQR